MGENSVSDFTTTATTQVRAAIQEVVQPAAFAGSATVLSEWESEAVRAALALKDLPDDWEASGSPKPTITAINGAIACIGSVAGLGFEALTAPFVAPMPDGGVQLEWDHGDRHLEIEVLPDGRTAYVMMRGAGSEIDSHNFRGMPALLFLFGRLMAAAH
jgi:hypothetical protein